MPDWLCVVLIVLMLMIPVACCIKGELEWSKLSEEEKRQLTSGKWGYFD